MEDDEHITTYIFEEITMLKSHIVALERSQKYLYDTLVIVSVIVAFRWIAS